MQSQQIAAAGTDESAAANPESRTAPGAPHADGCLGAMLDVLFGWIVDLITDVLKGILS